METKEEYSAGRERRRIMEARSAQISPGFMFSAVRFLIFYSADSTLEITAGRESSGSFLILRRVL